MHILKATPSYYKRLNRDPCGEMNQYKTSDYADKYLTKQINLKPGSTSKQSFCKEIFFYFLVFFKMSSSAFTLPVSTQILFDRRGIFCAGGLPMSIFRFSDGGLDSNPCSSDCQADALRLNQTEPLTIYVKTNSLVTLLAL